MRCDGMRRYARSIDAGEWQRERAGTVERNESGWIGRRRSRIEEEGSGTVSSSPLSISFYMCGSVCSKGASPFLFAKSRFERAGLCVRVPVFPFLGVAWWIRKSGNGRTRAGEVSFQRQEQQQQSIAFILEARKTAGRKMPSAGACALFTKEQPINPTTGGVGRVNQGFLPV